MAIVASEGEVALRRSGYSTMYLMLSNRPHFITRQAVLRCLLAVAAVSAVSWGSGGALAASQTPRTHQATSQPVARPPATDRTVQHLIYAAQDNGLIQVYDIDDGHRRVRTIRVFKCCGDVRGAAAAAPTHRFYVMYNRGNEGHVASVDLLSGRLLWDKVLHRPGVDRGSLTPDGRRLYLPTWENDDSSPYELVVDALTGTVRGRIPLPPRSHDTLVSLDGSRVFMETKSPTGTITVASTATDKIVGTIKGYCCGGVLAPFSVNGRGTLMVNDVVGFHGFELADIVTGRVIAKVPIAGPGSAGHGIAFTPSERQVWVNDGGAPLVYVFDMTKTPPRQVETIRVGHPDPHWVTFSLDGRFAYVSGRKGSSDPTEIIDAHTYRRVGQLSASEDLLEVDMSAKAVVAVGDQYGVGRL